MSAKQKVRKRVDIAVAAIKKAAIGLNIEDRADFLKDLGIWVEGEWLTLGQEHSYGPGGTTTSDVLGGAPPSQEEA